MARERYPWLKLWNDDVRRRVRGLLPDPAESKDAALTTHLAFRCWIVGMVIVNEEAPYDARRRGELRLENGTPVGARHFASECDEARVRVESALAVLCEAGLFGLSNGVYSIPDWRSRQRQDADPEQPINRPDIDHEQDPEQPINRPPTRQQKKDVRSKRPDPAVAVPPGSDLSLRPLAVTEEEKPPAREAPGNGTATAGVSHKARPGGTGGKRPTAPPGDASAEHAAAEAERLGKPELAADLRRLAVKSNAQGGEMTSLGGVLDKALGKGRIDA